MNRDILLTLLAGALASGNVQVEVLSGAKPEAEEPCECAACKLKHAGRTLVDTRKVFTDAKANTVGLDDELAGAKLADATADLAKAQDAFYAAVDAFHIERAQA